MFEKFTEKSINIISTAQKIASEYGSNKIHPEHILMGILVQKKILINRLLSYAYITEENVKNLILSKDFIPHKTDNAYKIGFSESSKKILTKTFEIAKKYDSHSIMPEHIFLALVEDRKSIVYKLLLSDEFNLERAKSNIHKLLVKNSKNITEHPEGTEKKEEIENYETLISILQEPSSNEIIQRAVAKLTASNYEILGTEQIVQSILEDENTSLTQLLKVHGINSDTFSNKLKEINSRQDEFEGRQLLFTPNAIKVLNLAIQTTKELGGANLIPEHIILGILKAKSGIAYKIFKELNIRDKELEQNIIRPIEKQMPETLTILRLAKQEARSFGKKTVGTEFILLGILGEAIGSGAEILNKLNITLKDVRSEIEILLGDDEDYTGDEVYYSQRAKKVLEVAWQKAKKHNFSTILSQHLLWAICKEKNALALQILNNLGIDINNIKQEILNKIEEQEQ